MQDLTTPITHHSGWDVERGRPDPGPFGPFDDATGAVAWSGGADLDPDVIYGIAQAAQQPAAKVTTPQPA